MGVLETVVLSTLFGGCASIVCGEIICAKNSKICNPLFSYCPFWDKCFKQSTGNGICNCKCILCNTCYNWYILTCKNKICCINNHVCIAEQETQTQPDIINIPPIPSLYMIEPYKQNSLTYGDSIPTYQESIQESIQEYDDVSIPDYDDHINYIIKN